MAVDVGVLVADLEAESLVLDGILAPLTPEQWRTPTPAVGWNVADQVSHLAYFDETARLAALDPDRFRAEALALVDGGMDFPDRVAALHRDRDPADLLAWFRSSRRDLLDTFARIDPTARLPWYGPDMGPASSLTARLMETWAHGQDVADTFGVQRPPSHRLRHVADLGVRTTGFAYVLNGRPVPTDPVHVALLAPDGATWTWGPPESPDRVTGTALDFCLVVTQRRHVGDTALTVEGPIATEWISIAQAFAGVPGPGRPPSTAATP